jgi:CheY-like chemotaxis protein
MTTFPESPHPESSRHDLAGLPRDSQPARSPVNPAGGGPASAPVKRSLRLLCIDDDEQILQTMQVCLGHLGHQVKVASGGKRGIEVFCTAILKSEPYDVVITDMSMPDVNGLEVAQAIKAESPKTPIILLSGAAGSPKDTEVPSASVDAVVNKPASLKQLNELLLRMAAVR